MIEAFYYYLSNFLSRYVTGEPVAPWVLQLAGITLLVLVAAVANWITKRIILQAIRALVRRTPMAWDDAMFRAGVFTRLSHVVPAVVVAVFGPDVLGETPQALAVVNAAVDIYLIVIGVGVFCALINAVVDLTAHGEFGTRVPVKGFGQAIKLVAIMVGGIFVLSALLGKSPVFLFSGLGAVTAIVLLVFRDTLLGFTAGITIAANEMVRIGDWIEIPKAGADGDVIDVTLTTVKVRNWDKTITTIPAYALVSDSFKNWRGMQESGGRRIKRAIPIDMNTVRFSTPEQIERWARIRVLQPYLQAKLEELKQANQESADADVSVLANGRRLTNLGTFRAYCIAYLRRHPQIHQELTFLVRQLAPNDRGLPLEIYVFTSDIRWAVYEAIQADIFDHLLAVIGEFDLKVFQMPTGRDVQSAAARLNAAAITASNT